MSLNLAGAHMFHRGGIMGKLSEAIHPLLLIQEGQLPVIGESMIYGAGLTTQGPRL